MIKRRSAITAKIFLITSLFIAFTICNSQGAGCLNCAQTDKSYRPNFVLVVIDDLGYGDLAIYGNHLHQTPNMDKLAREGLLFTDFHSNAPVCSPTRAAIMTGQYQQRSGIENAIGFDHETGLPLEKNTR